MVYSMMPVFSLLRCFYQNSRHLFEKTVLHLQHLGPQTPPAIRRWHFYLGHDLWKTKIPGAPIASRWAVHCPDTSFPQPRWGASYGRQPCTLSDLVFPKANGQLCLHRDCRTAVEIAIAAGEDGSFLLRAGPCAQCFLHSHVNGEVCEGRRHTQSQVQGSGPRFVNDTLYAAFTENGNEISCFITLKNALAYSEVDKIMSVLV